jgi:hypothetical protein
MQIPSIPPPIIANALPQDVAAKAVPNTQAMAPLVQHAVEPTPKSEKFNEVRRNKDRSGKNRNEGKRPDDDDEKDKKGDHSVNIRI